MKITLFKILRPVADAPCWFDLTRHDCGRCKNKGKQCGTPMQKWCQNPKSKNVSLLLIGRVDNPSLNMCFTSCHFQSKGKNLFVAYFDDLFQGCPGIPGNKFTLSTTGFPCYWDHSNKECAWCKTSKMKQCGVSSYTEACGQICAQGNKI